MNEADDIEQARQRAITRLQANPDEAAAMATDRFWQHGPFNVQYWVQRAFDSALAVLRQEEPADGEDVSSYLSRVAAQVHSMRDLGPDADDEAWFSSANEEACSLITGAQDS
jgi:hypothetical protein